MLRKPPVLPDASGHSQLSFLHYSVLSKHCSTSEHEGESRRGLTATQVHSVRSIVPNGAAAAPDAGAESSGSAHDPSAGPGPSSSGGAHDPSAGPGPSSSGGAHDPSAGPGPSSSGGAHDPSAGPGPGPGPSSSGGAAALGGAVSSSSSLLSSSVASAFRSSITVCSGSSGKSATGC